MENLTFKDLPLSEAILSAVAEMGFTTPSPIQEQSIPVLLQGRDVIGQAQTGTGKTAAFGIPLLEALDTTHAVTQALILCPTRELAVQVGEEIKKLARFMPSVTVAAVYGGDSIERQIRLLRQGAHIVVGTPGRVMDHLERGTLNTSNIRMAVLDEADEMLNMGFLEDMETILGQLPPQKQTILFSATMPAPILALTKRFQNDPVLVKVVRKELTSANIEQFYFPIHEEDKLALMTRLIEMHSLHLMLVFCNTKHRVDEVVEALQHRGFAAEGLHGDLSQAMRNTVMGRFRKGLLNILVATDVAARGIDVNDVDAVFNYDTPMDPEYYVHRIGRTGRAGKKGMSFTFALRRDRSRLRAIEQYTKVMIPKGNIPSVKDVMRKRQDDFRDQLAAQLETANIPAYAHLLDSLETASNGDLRRVLAVLLQREFEQKNQLDNREIMENEERSSKKPAFKERTERSSYAGNKSGAGAGKAGYKYAPTPSVHSHGSDVVRVVLHAGKNQNVSKGDILGAIANETGLSGKSIGLIQVKEQQSFVELPADAVDRVLKKMNRARIKGKKVLMEVVE